jgi:hypothetical protein
MTILTATLLALVAAATADAPAIIVQAPDTPVKIDRATVLTTTGAPPVIVYSATSQSDVDLDQFTVMVFVFDADGMLKARQTAPARRTLEAHTTKFSTIVLDGAPIGGTDQIVIGVNQAQRVNSDAWWRADIQPAAQAAVQHKRP